MRVLNSTICDEAATSKFHGKPLRQARSQTLLFCLCSPLILFLKPFALVQPAIQLKNLLAYDTELAYVIHYFRLYHCLLSVVLTINLAVSRF